MDWIWMSLALGVHMLRNQSVFTGKRKSLKFMSHIACFISIHWQQKLYTKICKTFCQLVWKLFIQSEHSLNHWLFQAFCESSDFKNDSSVLYRSKTVVQWMRWAKQISFSCWVKKRVFFRRAKPWSLFWISTNVSLLYGHFSQINWTFPFKEIIQTLLLHMKNWLPSKQKFHCGQIILRNENRPGFHPC